MRAPRAVAALVVVLVLVVSGCAVQPIMEPTSSGFLDMPWPNDIRRNADGTPEIVGWPGTERSPLLQEVLRKGSEGLDGFGPSSAVYFRTDGLVDAATLPSPEESRNADASAMLVNIDSTSDRHLERAPLQAEFRATASKHRPGNLMSLLPYPGFPLAPSARHAAILFADNDVEAGLRGVGNAPFDPSPLLAALEEPYDASLGLTVAEFDAMVAQFAEVKDYTTRHTDWDVDDIAGFTVYTTDDVTRDMDQVAAALDQLDVAPPENLEIVGTADPFDCDFPLGPTAQLRGTVELPRWQSGESPFLLDGGGIEAGSSGQAVLQGSDVVPVDIMVPCGEPPADGWPVVFFVDGTGAGPNAFSFSYNYLGAFDPEDPLSSIVVSIPPVFGDGRMPPEYDDQVEVLIDELFSLLDGRVPEELLREELRESDAATAFFSFFNPRAARSNQIQQAADLLALRRSLEGFVIPAELTRSDFDASVDGSRAVAAGHSQGALTIPLSISRDPDLAGGFLSGSGALLAQSLVDRPSVKGMLTLLLGDAAPRTIADPVIQGLHQVGERGDPINYAGDMDHADLLVTSGITDCSSPRRTANALATAAGLDVVDVPLDDRLDASSYDVFGLETLLQRGRIPLPAGSNLPGGRTGLFVQFAGDHFASDDNPWVGGSFLDDYREGDVAPATPDLPFERPYYLGDC